MPCLATGLQFPGFAMFGTGSVWEYDIIDCIVSEVHQVSGRETMLVMQLIYFTEISDRF